MLSRPYTSPHVQDVNMINGTDGQSYENKTQAVMKHFPLSWLDMKPVQFTLWNNEIINIYTMICVQLITKPTNCMQNYVSLLQLFLYS